jgi:crossover junction endodeoxyribonuclease RuvC
MRILGIDPGIATVGLGFIEVHDRDRFQSIEWATITTKPNQPLSIRLRELCDDLHQFLTDLKPEVAVMERLFFAKNRTSAMNVAQARGAIITVLEQHGIPLLEPSPLELKLSITSDGKADKRQMQDMVVRTLKLSEIPSPDDAVDALAMALYGTFTSAKFQVSSAKS